MKWMLDHDLNKIYLIIKCTFIFNYPDLLRALLGHFKHWYGEMFESSSNTGKLSYQ